MSSKLAKFRKAMEKKDIPVHFSPIPEWISTGNMALNYIISGDLRCGIPVGRGTFLSGPQGSGKSFLMGNIVKQAQDKGYTIIYIDTENSIDESFMKKLGVDLSEDKFIPIRVYSIEQATDVVSELFKTFDKDDKVGIFVDSLTNMESSQEIDKFESGELANTQGLIQKKYKQLVKGVNNRIGDRNMFAIFTTHVYQSQEQYGEKWVVSGGTSIQFLPSIGLFLDKKPLKEGKDFVGISVRLKTYKTRYQQLGKSTEFDLPYDRGMDMYDGVVPILESENVVERNGAWYSYISAITGETVKFQKSGIHEHIDELIKRYCQMKGSDSVIEKDDETANKESLMGEDGE